MKIHDVTNILFSKTIFKKILKSILNLLEYFDTTTIHAIRRALNKKLNDK